MKRKAIILLATVVVFGFVFVHGALGQEQKQEKGIQKIYTVATDYEYVIEIYGFPVSEQPFSNYRQGYQDVIIKNPNGYTIELGKITEIIDMTHFRTADEWRGFRVCRVVIKPRTQDQ